MPAWRGALWYAVKMRAGAVLAKGIWLLGLMGCSGADVTRPLTSDSSATLTELLAAMSARCAERVEAPSHAGPAQDQLFVEAAILQVSSAVAAEVTLANLRYLQTAQVELVATPHVIVDFNRATEMAWGQTDSMPERLSVVRWSLLPRRADGTVVLDVEMDLDLPGPKQAAAGSAQTVTFSTTVRENEPVLARVEWDAASHRSLLILFRTFEVHGERDLRAIFECKMQQRVAAQRRVGAAR
jgi:hypothetical protein